MPQPGQIIPNYLHPHVHTVVNDNTVFVDTVAPVAEGPRSLFVFASSRGRDNVILDKFGTTEFLAEYGTPSMKLYGQPQYNAYNWLLGRGVASCMRVMPADATYANVLVVAKLKAVAAVSGTPGSVTVRYEFLNDTASTTEDELQAALQMTEATDPDVEGFVTVPLFAVRVLGRGVYGNKYRVRLANSVQSDEETGIKHYRFEVLEFNGRLVAYTPFTGSFAPEAIVGTKSAYIADKVNSIESGSDQVAVHVNEEGFDQIFQAYLAAVPGSELEITEFDFFGGKVLNSTSALPHYTVVAPTVDLPMSLMSADGVPFDGGSDGALAVVAGDAATREAELDTLYSNAFRGLIDPRVKSRGRLPLSALLDAGYSDNVKRDLVALAVARKDALTEIDGGILATKDDLLAWAEEMYALGDYVVSKEGQHYKTRDPFTNRTITVTTSYSKAYRLPAHIRGAGIQTPVVGEENGALYGAIPGTVKPVVDIDDSDLKESLYRFRVNYYEQINERLAIRGTQSTSQTQSSDLSEENNVRVLLEIKRRVEALNIGLRYKLAEPDDRRRFTEDAQMIIDQYIQSRSIRTGEVQFGMSPYEEERSILHTYVSLIFPTMTKRSIVEIDVNRRV